MSFILVTRLCHLLALIVTQVSRWNKSTLEWCLQSTRLWEMQSKNNEMCVTGHRSRFERKRTSKKPSSIDWEYICLVYRISFTSKGRAHRTIKCRTIGGQLSLFLVNIAWDKYLKLNWQICCRQNSSFETWHLKCWHTLRLILLVNKCAYTSL